MNHIVCDNECGVNITNFFFVFGTTSLSILCNLYRFLCNVQGRNTRKWTTTSRGAWKRLKKTGQENSVVRLKKFWGRPTVRGLTNWWKTWPLWNGKATTVQDRSRKCLKDERQILNRWTEYCSELYNHKATGEPSVLNCPHTDTGDDHPILRKEVEAAVQSLKKGKSAGIDNIPADLVQAGGEDVITALTTICNKIWQTGEWATMKKYNISTNLIQVIKNLYNKAASAVLFNSSIGDWFRTTVEVRQGCLLSPTIFSIFLERITTDALEDHEGTVSIGGRTITNLRFADDIDGLAGEEEELANLVERLDKSSTAYGMEVSTKKTKLMTNNASGINTEIKVEWQSQASSTWVQL